MEKIKIAAVTYLNTKPFLFGLQHSNILKEIEVSLGHPAGIAHELQQGNVNVALLPVAVIPEIENAEIISDYCIGCNGNVSSVCIYSEVPLEDAKEIFFDYQSRTSAELARMLLTDFWKLNLRELPTKPGYENLIGGHRAGLIIGDRSLQAKNKFAYRYDLGEAWKQFTGMPFVFAAWVANKPIPSDFVMRFNEALAYGVNHSDEVARLNGANFPGIDVYDYFSDKIQFFLDEEKRHALRYFLSRIKEKSSAIVE